MPRLGRDSFLFLCFKKQEIQQNTFSILIFKNNFQKQPLKLARQNTKQQKTSLNKIVQSIIIS